MKKVIILSSKKLVSTVLALLMTAPALASCSSGTSAEVQTTQSGETQTETSEITETESMLPDVPERDYEGAEFVFMDTGSGYGSGYYETKDIVVESQNGEAFNDAVWERDAMVEEKFNIKITESKNNSVGPNASKSIMAGDMSFDAILTVYGEQYSLASSGALYDIGELPYLDLGNSWWDQNSVREFKLLGKNYFVAGDFSTLNSSCTRMVFFNKKLLEDYSLDDPYALVSDGKWTVDTFGAMVGQVSEDLDGNGEMNIGDRFGMFTEMGNIERFYYAFGGRMTSLDADGNPQIVLGDAGSMERITRVYDLFDDTQHMTDIEKWKDQGGFSNVYTYARALFTQDQYLFNVGSALIISEFRDMESEFGILPMPKYDESQEDYYCLVDQWGGLLSVPTNTADPEKTGIILEYFTAASEDTTVYAFNETLLKRKYSRDEESLAMLDIVNLSRAYDIGLDNWGLDLTVKRMLASDIEKLLPKSQVLLDKYMDELRSNLT